MREEETRARERACAAESACSPAGAWSIVTGRRSIVGGSVKVTPSKRYVHVPSARSILAPCMKNGAPFRGTLFTHGDPDNAPDVAITTLQPRQTSPLAAAGSVANPLGVMILLSFLRR